MGKRSVLAAVFVAMAVGLSGADDDGGIQQPPPPANSISIPPDTSTAGQVSFTGQFSGFKSPVIASSTIQVYKVSIDANGVRTETPYGSLDTKTYTPAAASGSHGPIIATGAKGDILRASFSLGTGANPVPQNAVLFASSGDATVK